MQKYSCGDVWLYEPDGGMNKKEIAKYDGLSRRPVVVLRGADENAPYEMVLVVACSTRSVPYIAFQKDQTSYSQLSKMEDLKVKPYEFHSVNMNRLTRYFGRLDDEEIRILQKAVMDYISGTAIADICDAESIEAWKQHKRTEIDPDIIRKEVAMRHKNDEKPITEVVSENTDQRYFTVPDDFETMRAICKSYCGESRPMASTITMIKTVPLSHVDTICEMSVRDIQTVYSISRSAAGAVKLLAADYINNGHQFSWMVESPTEDVDQYEESPSEEAEEDSTVFTLNTMPPVHEEPELEPQVEEKNYSDQLAGLKCYLTDNSLKYVPGDKLNDLLAIPMEVLEKNYSGSKFKLLYSALLKRAGKPALHQPAV